MSRRGRRGEARHLQGQYTEAVRLEEKQLPPVLNLSASVSGESRPLRLLDQFRFYTTKRTQGVEEPAGLQSLAEGLVDGRPLQASGMVLEHKLAEVSLTEARRAAYVNVRLQRVRDWVVDLSLPAAVWVITDVAWYRLLAPAADQAPLFASILQRLALLQVCMEALQLNRKESFESAVSTIVALWGANQRRGEEGDSEEGGGQPGAQQGILEPLVPASIMEHAAFLAPQLAVILGRHAGESGLVCGLAKASGFQLAEAQYAGRPLLEVAIAAPSADPAARPQPQAAFLVEPALRPGILMVWDFCQTYRELLRLPPFPLRRLELAFVEEPGEGKGPQQQGCLLRDLHLSLLRILEGVDTALLEPPTMAGYGSAADLGPQDVYKPLLPVTWPELARLALLESCSRDSASPAAAANRHLKEVEYCQLGSAERLAVLEALVLAAADTEKVRDFMHEHSLEAVDEKLSRGTPLGVDDSGSRYFQLAATSGNDRLFVEIRREGAQEGEPGVWGWYDIGQVPQLLSWLQSGSRGEQELAEDLFAAFQAHLQAFALTEQHDSLGTVPEVRLEVPADGYAVAQADGDAAAALRQEVLDIFGAVRFWEKSGSWLKAQAAVLADLEVAETGQEFAKLLWLVEDLMYTDLLKGTGWGRKRARFRELLETASTIAQAAVAVCQFAVQCRRSPDLGFMREAEFRESVKAARVQPSFIPTKGTAAVLLRSGYSHHIQQARPPTDALSAPLPRSWGFAEQVVVKEVRYAHGNWQRPSWQGRFADGPAAPHQEAHDLVLACLIVEREAGKQDSGPKEEAGAIDWEGFSFQTGFSMSRWTPASRPPSANPSSVVGSPALQKNQGAASQVPPTPNSSSETPQGSTDGSPRHAEALQAAQHLAGPAGAASTDQRATEEQIDTSGSRGSDTPQSGKPSLENLGAAIMTEGQKPVAQAEASLGPEADEKIKEAEGSPSAAAVPQHLEPESPVEAAKLQQNGPVQIASSQEKAVPEAILAAETLQRQTAQPRASSHLDTLVPSLRPLNGTIAPPELPKASNNILLELSRAAFRQQAAPNPFKASEPEAKEAGLRRSSRVRTEVSMPEYEAGREWLEGPLAASNGRGDAASWYFTGLANPYAGPQAAVAHQDGAFRDEDFAAVKYWRVERDLAAVVLYVRKAANTSVEYLVLPHVFAAATNKPWNRGTIVKMPAYSNLPRAAAIPNMKWYTGVLNAAFTLQLPTLPALSRQLPVVSQGGPHHIQAAQPANQPRPTWTANLPESTAAVSQIKENGQAGIVPADLPTAKPQTSTSIDNAAALPPGLQVPAPVSRPEDKDTALPSSIGPASIAPGLSALKPPSPAPRPAAGIPWQQPFSLPGAMPGSQLSSLMPQGSYFGGVFSNGSLNGILQSGGPGGPADPWKALSVSWDAGTVTGWPNRVSPWEVMEDSDGVVRAANEKAHQELQAKQRADANARQMHAPPAMGLAQLAANPAYAALYGARSAASQLALQQRLPVSGVPVQSGSVAPGATMMPAPYSYTQGIVHGQQLQWRPTQLPGYPLMGHQMPSWPQAPGPAYLPYFAARPPLAAQLPAEGHQASSRATRGGAEERAAARKRKSMEIEERRPPKVSSEGYRERWLAKKPRPNPNTWLSGFCSACEKGEGGEGLFSCMGPCLRAFHAKCVGLNENPQHPETWFCPECDSGYMRCFLCNKFSSRFGDAGFRKCSLGVCGRFYHLDCARVAPLAQFARKGGHFRCPQHYCMSCGKSGDGMDMAKCIRCPSAYHSACMSSTSAKRLHPHSKVVLCENHNEDENPPGYVWPPSAGGEVLPGSDEAPQPATERVDDDSALQSAAPSVASAPMEVSANDTDEQNPGDSSAPAEAPSLKLDSLQSATNYLDPGGQTNAFPLADSKDPS